MKRFVRFLSIFLIMGLGTIAIFSVKPKALEDDINDNPVSTNAYDGFIPSVKYYFKDWNEYYGEDNEYWFDFSFIPEAYDYFIFNFRDNGQRNLYELSSSKSLFVNTGVGVRIVERIDLIWSINFNDITDDDDYYFIACNYNQIINLNDYLTDAYYYGFDDGLFTGYDRGYDDGLGDGYDTGYDTGYDYGYDDGLDDGYAYGYDDGLDDGYITGYDTGYDKGYDDGSQFSFDEGYAQARDEFGAFIDDKWQGYDDGYAYGYDYGYFLGYNESGNNDFTNLIGQVFAGLGSFLSIELLPNITFGAIFAVPLVFGIIFFIIGKRGGKDD